MTATASEEPTPGLAAGAGAVDTAALQGLLNRLVDAYLPEPPADPRVPPSAWMFEVYVLPAVGGPYSQRRRANPSTTLHVDRACRHIRKGRVMCIEAKLSDLALHCCQSCRPRPAAHLAAAVPAASAWLAACKLLRVNSLVWDRNTGPGALSTELASCRALADEAAAGGVDAAFTDVLYNALDALDAEVAAMGPEAPEQWWAQAGTDAARPGRGLSVPPRPATMAAPGLTWGSVNSLYGLWASRVLIGGLEDGRAEVVQTSCVPDDPSQMPVGLLPDRPALDPAGFATLRDWMAAEAKAAASASASELLAGWEDTYRRLVSDRAPVDLLGLEGVSELHEGLGEKLAGHFPSRTLPGGLVLFAMPGGLAAWLVGRRPDAFVVAGPAGSLPADVAEIAAGLVVDGKPLSDALALARLV